MANFNLMVHIIGIIRHCRYEENKRTSIQKPKFGERKSQIDTSNHMITTTKTQKWKRTQTLFPIEARNFQISKCFSEAYSFQKKANLI